MITIDNTKRYRTFVGMINYDYFVNSADKKVKNNITKEQFQELILQEILKEKSKIDYLTLIAHNRDLLDPEAGTLKGCHIHFIVRYKNARTLKSVLTALQSAKLTSRNLSAVNSIASSLLYLTHTTTQAIKEKKTRYEVSELTIFADSHLLNDEEKEQFYREKISGHQSEMTKKFDDTPLILDILKEIKKGLIPTDTSLFDYIKSLSNLYTISDDEILLFIRKNRKKFDEDRDAYLIDKIRAKKINGRDHELVYINGLGGLGKSLLASDLAKKLATKDEIFYSSSAGRNADLLSQYSSQEVAIFDDLNKDSFENVQAFLKLFEQNNVSLVQSRYRNKDFLADYSFITKSETAESFINSIYRLDNSLNIDPNLKQQIMRRFSLILELELHYIVVKQVKRKKGSAEFEIKEIERIKFDNIRYIELLSSYDTDTEEFQKLNKKRDKILEKIVTF